MKPSKLWITLVSVALVVLLLPAFLQVASRAGQEIVPPVWGRKPVLEYFFLTAGLAEKLQAEVGLSDEQFQALQAITRQERDQLRQLKLESEAIANDTSLSQAEKSSRIQASGYNQRVQQVMFESQAAVQSILEPSAYARLVEWIETQWLVERELHGIPEAVEAARTYTVYMTYFDSSDYNAFLPDQCVKFSNLGLTTWCTNYGYKVGANYSIRIKYGGKSVTIRPKDVGPWNINDTYWATAGDPTPRRKFTDLPLGMPEAQAAYYDDYNNGKDEFGRTVTAPFAVEITFAVAPDLGLKPGQNAWVNVTFLWTDGWDATPTLPPTATKTPTVTPTPTTTPTPTPTSTPTPGSFLHTGSGLVQPGQPVTIPVGMSNVYFPGLSYALLDLKYDPNVVAITGCQANPAGDFLTGGCYLKYEHDGINPDTVRFSVYAIEGITGTAHLANLIFQGLGAPGSYSPLILEANTLSGPSAESLDFPTFGAGICQAPCQNIFYFPLFGKEWLPAP